MKKLIKRFKSEGWKHRWYYDLWSSFSHKFKKDGYVIRIPTNNVDIEGNGVAYLVGWHEFYMEDNLRYCLKNICSDELTNMIIQYIKTKLRDEYSNKDN